MKLLLDQGLPRSTVLHLLNCISESTEYCLNFWNFGLSKVLAITVNIGPEKAGVGGSAPSLATMFSSSCKKILKLPLDSINWLPHSRLPVTCVRARPTSAPAGVCSAKRGQNSKSMENCSCLGMPALFAVANAGMGELPGP